ncbi:Bbp16 family capsid cement protein [Azospirillum doebereinerae]|uniref:Bbp16 family capsid cement protein n=1 Tax=Azospirillum doebereinerae TaxID=92933 RepID=UPI001EE57EA7|nr:hypothetical protein [Azospirillum doebereinerae]MCG5241394.1 hypothetical protein [Azospirillum doebereinerae]
MIFDLQSLLSNAQAVTASAASTNLVDLKAHGTAFGHAAPLPRDWGKGKKVPLLIQVVETFATLTSLTVSVQVDDNAAFSSPKTIATTPAVVAADLVAGRQFVIDAIPRGSDEQFLRLYYTVAGSNATAGKITAGAVPAIQTNG